MKTPLLQITSNNQEFNKTVELQPNTENELNHLVTEGLATKEEDTYVIDYDILFKELQKQDYQEATATPLYLFGNRIINDLRNSASTESNEQLNNLAVEVENYFHKFDFQKETYQDVDIQSGYAYNKFELRFLSLEKVEEVFNEKYNKLIEEIDEARNIRKLNVDNIRHLIKGQVTRLIQHKTPFFYQLSGFNIEIHFDTEKKHYFATGHNPVKQISYTMVFEQDDLSRLSHSIAVYLDELESKNNG